MQRLFNSPNASPYVKDAFHEYIIHQRKEAINPNKTGTKAALHYVAEVAPGGTFQVKLRLSDQKGLADPFKQFDAIFQKRKKEADEFYGELACPKLTPEHYRIQRQAFAGMLWNKQFYYYVVDDWLHRDPLEKDKLPKRKIDRNGEWGHLYNDDIHSTPDKWEFPWFFSWDIAFHTLPIAMIDPEFAKKQLALLMREWYMHPNGQMPAYEWSFSDVNPPVHAWATWRVYKICERLHRRPDRAFLEGFFKNFCSILPGGSIAKTQMEEKFSRAAFRYGQHQCI